MCGVADDRGPAAIPPQCCDIEERCPPAFGHVGNPLQLGPEVGKGLDPGLMVEGLLFGAGDITFGAAKEEVGPVR